MRSTSRRATLLRSALALALLSSPVTNSLAQETAPAAETPAVAPIPPETVVATIDGKPVTQGDLELAIADLGQQFARLPEEQRRAAALSAVIEIRLMAQKAVADKLDADPEFQRRLDFLRQRTLHTAVIDKEIAAKITDDQIRARYDQEIAAKPPVEEVRARHILVNTKEEADALIVQLDGGADFQKLANENTKDPSGATTGGDLGFFGPGQMVPEFEKAAFALAPGSYTKEPVQSQFGWHIILVEEKRKQASPAFDQVKDQIRSLVLRDQYFAMVKSLRDGAKVDISDAKLKSAVEAIDTAQ